MSSQSILQSGNVTPGHRATWATDGVLQDGGAIPASDKVLASLRGADFTATSDQPLIIPPAITAFHITKIIVTNASASLNVAAGGFYPAVSKGGTAIVAAGQVYSSLTDANKLLLATIQAAALATRWSAANLGNPFGTGLAIYLSLTTGQVAAATADVFLTGIDLS